MKLIITQLNNESREILISRNEAEQISQALWRGVKFLKIGDQTINASYIVGVFEGQEPNIGPARRIEAPKTDTKKIGQILNEMRKGLKTKGIIK